MEFIPLQNNIKTETGKYKIDGKKYPMKFFCEISKKLSKKIISKW